MRLLFRRLLKRIPILHLLMRLRLAALSDSPAFSPAQVRSLRGVRLLHLLADSGQGFLADSQRGAIAQAIDAKTLQAFRIPQARIKKSGNQP